ncbi:hypothetical protein KI387_012996, partial [Taxus chinensis]
EEGKEDGHNRSLRKEEVPVYEEQGCNAKDDEPELDEEKGDDDYVIKEDKGTGGESSREPFYFV